MSAAAVAFTNLLDAAATVISGGGANTLSPYTNLQNEHVSVKWRLNGTTAYIIWDLGSLQSLDTFALMGLSGSSPTLRFRASTVDATGVAGNAWDTGSLSGAGLLPYYDSRYKKFVALANAPVSARYLRMDMTEAAVAYQEAGRHFGGLRKPFGINLQTPYVRTPVRKSLYTRGVGGSTFIDRRKGTWRQSASFGFLSETERTGFIDDMAVLSVNSGHLDFLWIPDPASLNLARDCIWGFNVPDEQPVTQTLYVVPPVYTVEFQVEDRG